LGPEKAVSRYRREPNSKSGTVSNFKDSTPGQNYLPPLLRRAELRVSHPDLVQVVIFVAEALRGLMGVFERIEDGKNAGAIIDFHGSMVQAEIAKPVLLQVLQVY
jgi:hypothetical protein